MKRRRGEALHEQVDADKRVVEQLHFQPAMRARSEGVEALLGPAFDGWLAPVCITTLLPPREEAAAE